MIKVKEIKNREFQIITEKEKINTLILKHLVGKVLFFKNRFQKENAYIVGYDLGLGLTIRTHSHLNKHITLYSVLKKYIDLDCTLLKSSSDHYHLLEVKVIRIATESRQHERFYPSVGSIAVRNIRMPRNIINTSLFKIPTSVKIHFSQYEQKLKSSADKVVIKLFDKTSEKLELVRKSSKCLYIANTQDVSSYMPENQETFINYLEHLHTDMRNVMQEYNRNKIVSELIVPIIYIDHRERSIPLGYIQLISHTNPIEMTKVMNTKALSFEIVERIRSSNMITVDSKQDVQNISLGGLQFIFKDEELKKKLMNQKELNFNVIFKLQPPINIFARVVHTILNNDDYLLFGLKIIGESTNKNNIKRYHDLINHYFSNKTS